MLSFKFDRNENILFVEESGSVSFNEKQEYIQEVLNILNNSKKLKILQDSREAILNFSIEKIEIIRNKIVERLNDNNTMLIQAVIYDSGIETAYSIIYEKMNLPKNYIHKVFSTKEAALQWLNKY